MDEFARTLTDLCTRRSRTNAGSRRQPPSVGGANDAEYEEDVHDVDGYTVWPKTSAVAKLATKRSERLERAFADLLDQSGLSHDKLNDGVPAVAADEERVSTNAAPFLETRVFLSMDGRTYRGDDALLTRELFDNTSENTNRENDLSGGATLATSVAGSSSKDPLMPLATGTARVSSRGVPEIPDKVTQLFDRIGEILEHEIPFIERRFPPQPLRNNRNAPAKPSSVQSKSRIRQSESRARMNEDDIFLRENSEQGDPLLSGASDSSPGVSTRIRAQAAKAMVDGKEIDTKARKTESQEAEEEFYAAQVDDLTEDEDEISSDDAEEQGSDVESVVQAGRKISGRRSEKQRKAGTQEPTPSLAHPRGRAFVSKDEKETILGIGTSIQRAESVANPKDKFEVSRALSSEWARRGRHVFPGPFASKEELGAFLQSVYAEPETNEYSVSFEDKVHSEGNGCSSCRGSGLRKCIHCLGDGWLTPPTERGSQSERSEMVQRFEAELDTQLRSARPAEYDVEEVWTRADLVLDMYGYAQCVFCNGAGNIFCESCEGSGRKDVVGFDAYAEHKRVFGYYPSHFGPDHGQLRRHNAGPRADTDDFLMYQNE
ncbi:hypothetical protein FVE85_7942 [Porphyridium purpureum]|uniref:Uncharacterized protein n=1 Tax=Porphyridium purpureum TaxID=35688 RepID=A0A5J4YMQ4_PORPP|nr:hypothetical protein FVE85_7942 [Porphyridium purpureum]|eukprot:POR2287..scf295_9